VLLYLDMILNQVFTVTEDAVNFPNVSKHGTDEPDQI
jgi:hypothetical protein